MTSYPERLQYIALIDEAISNGARQHRACETAGISVRTLQRWQRNGVIHSDKRPGAIRPAPANQLSQSERQRILQVCSDPDYADKPPCQIVPALADRGIYVASESSFYRVLKAEGLGHHRGRAKAHGTYVKPKSYTVTAPNRCGHGI